MLRVPRDPEERGSIRSRLWVRPKALHDSMLTISRIFSALGEMGPGDNIGLCAAKSSATSIRGQYYGIAAAAGKIGAFVGTYVIPIVRENAPNEVRKGQDPFFVSSSLCIFSAALAYFLLPQIGQVCSAWCLCLWLVE